MSSIANPGGCGEQDKVDHQQQAEPLGPVGGVIEDIPGKYLPANDHRHQHQADAAEPQACPGNGPVK